MSPGVTSRLRGVRGSGFADWFRRYKIFVNGAWVPSAGTGTLSVTDSATEEVIATIPSGTAADVDAAVAAAKAAFPAWRAVLSRDVGRPRGPHPSPGVPRGPVSP